MSLMSLPKMFLSETEGWPDLVRIHPSVTQLLVFFVAPLSLIPPLMYAYAGLVQPDGVFPLMQPPLTGLEAFWVGSAFFMIELATVAIMAAYIQQLGDAAGVHPEYAEAYTLAAIAPTPLWLSALVLFIPSMGLSVLVVALAWAGSVALIRHGVRPLFRLAGDDKVRSLANAITMTGVAAWAGLMLVLVLLLSIALGWR